MPHPPPNDTTWSLMTQHARVLVCITRDPNTRVTDIAEATGLTQRTVHAIIRQLELDGALERRRVGRRNSYRIIDGYRPRNPMEAGMDLGQWLTSLEQGPDDT